jgi:hypothetical protein
LFDLVEEPLDQVSGAIKARTEADRLLTIAPWWNVGPSAFLGGNVSDPVGVIATIQPIALLPISGGTKA